MRWLCVCRHRNMNLIDSPHPTGNWSWKSCACLFPTARKMMRLLCLCVHRIMNVITPPHPTPPHPPTPRLTDHERAVRVSALQQERWWGCCACAGIGTWTLLTHPTPPVTDHERAVPVSSQQQERWWGCCACVCIGSWTLSSHPTPPHPPTPPPPPTKPEMAGSQPQCARMTALCARMTRFLCAQMTRLQCAQMTRFQCAQMTRWPSEELRLLRHRRRIAQEMSRTKHRNGMWQGNIIEAYRQLSDRIRPHGDVQEALQWIRRGKVPTLEGLEDWTGRLKAYDPLQYMSLHPRSQQARHQDHRQASQPAHSTGTSTHGEGRKGPGERSAASKEAARQNAGQASPVLQIQQQWQMYLAAHSFLLD